MKSDFDWIFIKTHILPGVPTGGVIQWCQHYPKKLHVLIFTQWIYFHTSISIICKKYLYNNSNTYHKALCIPILDHIFFLKSVDPPLLLVGNPGWFQSTLEYSGWDLGLR